MGCLVSVIVPVYNVERYIERCVSSILAQTYTDMEVILVDDGSTDRSGSICEDFKEQDARIKVVHQQNGGLSSARNTGIDIARGEYFSFIDSDDYIVSTFVEELLELALKHKAQIAQCGYRSVEENAIPLKAVESDNYKIYSPEEAVQGCCVGQAYFVINNTVTWNKLYHRGLFEELRFPEGKIHEDEFLTYQLKWKANRLVTTDRCLYYYFQRADSITGHVSLKRINQLEAYKQKEEFLKAQGMESAYSASVIRRYYSTVKFYDEIPVDNVQEHITIRKNLLLQIEELRKDIMALENKLILDKYRILYPCLSEKEKKNLVKKYGTIVDASNNFSIRYLFPYTQIPQGSKIILYGAGQVGKDYYRQLKSNHFCDVVAWVDLAWRELRRGGFPVEPQDRLVDCKYDFVILATVKKELAGEIARQLKAWRIPESKIFWAAEQVCSLREIKELLYM